MGRAVKALGGALEAAVGGGGEREGGDLAGTLPAQQLGGRGERRAGGDDVVDQQDGAPGEARRYRVVNDRSSVVRSMVNVSSASVMRSVFDWMGSFWTAEALRLGSMDQSPVRRDWPWPSVDRAMVASPTTMLCVMTSSPARSLSRWRVAGPCRPPVG